MRLLVCGDRYWNDKQLVQKVLSRLVEESPDSVTVIHGAARGADRIAGEVAKSLGCEVVEFPAQWHSFGRAAGPIRNQKMLDEGAPSAGLAFHDNIEASKGTADMLKRLKRANVPFFVVSHP
jgi:SLOG family YspA-like protein